MKALFLQPLDVWVFRDGRPFSAGEDHHAKCVFPPSPLTVQGALRSKVLTENCGNLDKFAGREGAGDCPKCGTAPQCPLGEEIGTPSSLGPFRLRYVLPARRRGETPELYLLLPRHIVQQKTRETNERRWHRLAPTTSNEATSLPDGLCALGVRAAAPVEYRGGWVSLSALGRLLAGDVPKDLAPVRTRDGEGDREGMLAEEPRVGIGIERGRRTARHGQFFIVDALRLRDEWGLAVGFEGLPSLAEESLLDIGGEGRAARYSTVAPAEWPTVPLEAIGGDGRFVVYLATPALFGDEASGWSWRPRFLGSDGAGTLPGTGVTARLVAAAVGQPERFSGWELGAGGRGGRPRPMRSAVPAGSVYFFELNGGGAEGLAALQGRPMTDWGAEYGFGVALIGRW